MNKEKLKISILGSGWLGLPLAEHLVQSGYPVKASARSEHRISVIEAYNATGIKVDTENLPGNIQDFLNSKILIINITSKNINAFKSLIKEIESSPIEKVLFVSSTSVYKNLNRLVTEDEGAEDGNSVLFQIENLFRYNSNFETTILRFAGLIGYERHPGRWFTSRPVLQADAPVNLIHRDDCIGIIDAIIEQNAWSEVFNACASDHPSKREFYSFARKLLGDVIPEFAVGKELKYKIISNKKVQTSLNYKFAYDQLMSLTFD